MTEDGLKMLATGRIWNQNDIVQTKLEDCRPWHRHASGPQLTAAIKLDGIFQAAKLTVFRAVNGGKEP
jgi:hypothetical protein